MSRSAHFWAFYSLVLLALCHLVEVRRPVDVDVDVDETAAAGSAPD